MASSTALKKKHNFDTVVILLLSVCYLGQGLKFHLRQRQLADCKRNWIQHTKALYLIKQRCFNCFVFFTNHFSISWKLKYFTSNLHIIMPLRELVKNNLAFLLSPFKINGIKHLLIHQDYTVHAVWTQSLRSKSTCLCSCRNTLFFVAFYRTSRQLDS